MRQVAFCDRAIVINGISRQTLGIRYCQSSQVLHQKVKRLSIRFDRCASMRSGPFTRDFLNDVCAFSFIGQGPPRFYLPVDPEMAYPSYGQIITNVASLSDVDEVMAHIEPWLEENAFHALTRVRKYGVGSWDDWKFEARFSGPWNADRSELRRLGAEAVEILRASPLAKEDEAWHEPL